MDPNENLINRITGLGKHSFKKSYYPELQDKISELNLFKSVIDQTSDIIIIIKPADGYIVEINNAAILFFDYCNAEFRSYISDIISEKYWRIVRDILSDPESLANANRFKYRINISEQYFYIDNSISLIENSGTNYGTLIIRDITESIKIEKQLQESKEKAEESNRLKAAFLANMSHEIRTPMNGIVGFVGLLNEKSIDESAKKNYYEIITSCSNDLLRIIDDILDISKLEAGQVSIMEKEFNINKMLDEVYHIYQQRISKSQKNILLNYNYALNNNEAHIIADGVRIKQVFVNLLDNALKFTSEGNISFGYEIKNNKLIFYVKDSGIGINKNKIEIIFDRFRQSDENLSRLYGGTGLGLSICKGLVELMNGTIEAESIEKKGSTFRFTIPYINT